MKYKLIKLIIWVIGKLWIQVEKFINNGDYTERQKKKIRRDLKRGKATYMELLRQRKLNEIR